MPKDFSMKYILFAILVVLIGSLGCGQDKSKASKIQEMDFPLSDFYKENKALDKKVESYFSKLDDAQKIGQMLIVAAGRLGKPDKTVEALINGGKVGGVLLLNGSKSGFKSKTSHFDSIAQAAGTLPLMYSADAEPSLVNRKITETPAVPPTESLKTPAEGQ